MNASGRIAAFFLLAAAAAASNLYLLIPIYAEVAAGLRGSPEEIVWSASLFTFFYSIGLLCFGPVSSLFGRRRTMAAGLLICAVLAYLLTGSQSPASFQMIRGLQGFFLASFAPVAYSYCFETFTEEVRTHLISLINGGFLLAGVAGQMISSLLTQFFGWQAVFWFFCAAFSIIALTAALLLPASKRRASGDALDLSVLFRSDLFPCYVLTFSLLMAFAAFYDSFSRYFSDAGDEILFLSRTAGLAGALLSFWSGPIMRRIGIKSALTGSVAALSAVLAAAALLPYLPVATLLSIWLTASMAMLLPALITRIGELAGDSRASAISFYSFILLAGASAGPILAYHFPFKALTAGFSLFFGAFALIFLKQAAGPLRERKNPDS
ncbi:MFS transporter [Metabacillus sp. 113a]|uniref:MFS transporter n=1 Tax=Metabacillus sp. 113a TaxID=3404706 RepID=UPI003CE99A00